MSILVLTIKEICYRKTGFLLGIISVTIAVGILVAEFTLLDIHDLRTYHLLKKKEAETRNIGIILEDDYRKIMKEMGFNLILLPEDQDLAEFYETGDISGFMPGEYAEKLAKSGLESIRHVLPCLERKIEWKEQEDLRIILCGIKGEIVDQSKTRREPILKGMDQGKISVGYELAKRFKLKPGDRLELSGRNFTVKSCQDSKGNREDITVWIKLEAAQEILDQKGRINAILALKCHCANVDISNMREQITRILPDVQVIELAGKAEARAEVRDRAKKASEESLALEKTNRAKIRKEMESFASWLIPLIIVGSTTWIGLLSYANVRERRLEIGILSAIGYQPGTIAVLFLLKAILIGFIGGLLGYICGFGLGLVSANQEMAIRKSLTLFDIRMLGIFLIMAPVLCVLASLVPALNASRENPADIFCRE